MSNLPTLDFFRGRLWRILLLGAAMIFLPPGRPGLSGQIHGLTVRGSVVDTLSGDPVSGALLRLDTGLDLRSGPDGSFSLAQVEPGTRRVAIVTSGCVVSFATFDAAEASLAPLVIQVRVRTTNQDLAPPDPLPGSRILSGEDIEELHVGTMGELLRRVAPELIQSVPGQPGVQPRIISRGVASAFGPVSPILVMDGVNLGSLESPDVLEAIHPDDIAYLEIFRGAVGGWWYGTGGSGGVVRVTTKRGGTLSPPDLDLTRCAIPNWRRRPLDL